MYHYIVVLIITCLLAAMSSSGFKVMDCPGDKVSQGYVRKCCVSGQLPKGCECYVFLSSLYKLIYKPQCPAAINVLFNLYTRAHRLTAQRIHSEEVNIKSTRYNGVKKTVFIAHGFTDTGSAPWCIAMKNALLDYTDMNVIVVDWRQGAKGPNYMQAASNTRVVGSMIARLIQDMHSSTQAEFENFHLIGHSLGAHVMGFAGKEIFRLTYEKIGRITGLDPAGPLFSGGNHLSRLDSTDGRFVDIIHTDAEKLVKIGFGILNAIGHVDFYPNGGEHQPGCPEEKLLSLIDFKNFKEKASCSHSRVVNYFTHSISRCRYNSPDRNIACTMGYHVSTSCRGVIYSVTKSIAPFC